MMIAVYVRGLREAFRRAPENSLLRTLIQSYVDVQVGAFAFDCIADIDDR